VEVWVCEGLSYSHPSISSAFGCFVVVNPHFQLCFSALFLIISIKSGKVLISVAFTLSIINFLLIVDAKQTFDAVESS